MRAGFAAWGPGLVLKLFSASKRYGFELSPRERASAVTDAMYHVQLVRARLPGAPAFFSS